MKWLLLTENYPPNIGGMAQSCDRIVGNLRDNGVNVDVFHFTNHGTAFMATYCVGGAYTALPKPNDVAHGLNVALSYFEHHVDISSYDGMLVFGGHLPVSAAPVYSVLLGLDYYLCLRGNDFDVSLFDAKKRATLRAAIESAKGVLVGSIDKVNKLKKLHPNVPAHYAPNSIDLDSWQAFDSERRFASQWRQQNVHSARIVIGLIGYMKTKKGVRFFLNALMNSQCVPNVHLMLSGEQPEEVLELLSQYEISFTQIPIVERFDLIKYLLACDWVAIPSYYEGMPNVMLEAGGLGVPVLASAVDGMRDLIEHEQTGLLFKPLDGQDCARRIRQCVEFTPQQRNDIGLALQRTIKDQYTPQHEVDVYLRTLSATTPVLVKKEVGVKCLLKNVK